ncbi:MAG: T9SS type A sorting domain-containing protein, partial [Saprospiraceae bacterium]
QNNLVSYATYGFIGSGTGTANTTLAMYFNPNWVVTKNAIIGGSSNGYPVGNYFPANNTAVQFEDYASGDYRLMDSSPYKNLGTDGKDLGADIDSIAIVSEYQCDLSTGLKEEKETPLVMVLSPSPANDQLHIQGNWKEGSSLEIRVVYLTGHLINSMKSNLIDEMIDTSLLPNGIYIVQIKLGKNLLVRKFVVIH